MADSEQPLSMINNPLSIFQCQQLATKTMIKTMTKTKKKTISKWLTANSEKRTAIIHKPSSIILHP